VPKVIDFRWEAAGSLRTFAVFRESRNLRAPRDSKAGANARAVMQETRAARRVDLRVYSPRRPCAPRSR